jgi:ligand-binding sensor domain-containing protein/two-component sensor histidine kinase
LRPVRPKKLSALLSATLLMALTLALPSLARAEHLPVRVYTSADGLGSNIVSYMMRDSRGFMWFCTRDGLSRFDGSRFVTYQIGDKNAPPGIEQIIETRGGIYWIVTTGGTYRFDPSAPSANRTQNKDRPALNAELTSNERGIIYEDHSGNLWWGAGGGLYLLEENNGQVHLRKVELNLPANPSAEITVSSMLEAHDGSLWVVTTEGLVRRLRDGRVVFYSFAASHTDVARSVVEDRQGRIWFARISGLYAINPEPLEEVPPGVLTVHHLDNFAHAQSGREQQVRLPEKPGEVFKYSDVKGFAYGIVKFLCETLDGHIWISGGDGLVEFDGQTFRQRATAQGLIKGTGSMLEDASGNLWLGWQTSLMRLDWRGLTTYDDADGLKNPVIININETPSKLYVATTEFFLSQFDGKGFQTVRPPLPPNARGLWTANTTFQDHTGEWWFLTNEGLYRFAASQNFGALEHQRPLATYTSRDGLKGDMMFHIFEDSKGDLWVCTNGERSEQYGLSRWNRATGKFYTFSAAEGLPPDKSPSSFAEDRNGNLWFGFYDGGLVRYVGGRFVEFTTDDGLPPGLITALHIDRQGRLWAGSSRGGLSRVDDTAASRPSFVNYTTDSGLASNNVRSITEDLYGNIYAGTARGIDKLSPDATRITHYSIKDGLAGDFVSSAFRDRSGALWFGTPNGLSRLVPEADVSSPAPTVWLGGLRIAGESSPVPELGGAEIFDLELGPAQNNLQIDFFGIDFTAGETLRYQYMLEGADHDWNAPTEQRTVNYSNLAPGSYRYFVRAVNADGVTSRRPASVSFRVLSPVWRRWWFLTIAAILIGLAIYAADRYRVARLLDLERVRTRIATDLHDDIGASLSRMAVLSEVVKRQTEVDHRESADMLTEIADSARGLVDSMSDIVWSIDPRKDDLKNVVLRIRQFASDVLEARAIDWEFKAPEEIANVKLAPEQRRHLFLIFKEAINNAARHSESRSVSLDISLSHDRLVAEIRDDGRGFAIQPGEQLPLNGRGGNGLRNMKARAAEIGGQLNIVSSPGGGTQLTLVVPLRGHVA